MRLTRSSALLRDSSEMNPEGAQEKNKWNDVELCGIMRNAPIIEITHATGWGGRGGVLAVLSS